MIAREDEVLARQDRSVLHTVQSMAEESFVEKPGAPAFVATFL